MMAVYPAGGRKISVVLPVLNERQTIIPLLAELQRVLRGYCYEIIVVDDESSDGTTGLLKEHEGPAIRVITRTSDHGYAKSIRCGIEQASGEIVVIMDSDFNHDPGSIPVLLGAMPDYDCVSASRFLKGGRMVPAWRGLCSLMFNRFIRLMTGIPLSDSLFGFFAVRRAVFDGCPFDEIFFGFGDYGIRLFSYFRKKGIRVLEVPAVCGIRRSGRGNRRYWRTLRSYIRATLEVADRERCR